MESVGPPFPDPEGVPDPPLPLKEGSVEEVAVESRGGDRDGVKDTVPVQVTIPLPRGVGEWHGVCVATTLPLPPQGEDVTLREGDWVGDMVVVTASLEGDTKDEGVPPPPPLAAAAAAGGEGEAEAVSHPKLWLTVTLREVDGEGEIVTSPLLTGDALPVPPPATTPPDEKVAGGVLRGVPLGELVSHVLGLPEEVSVGVGSKEVEGEPEWESFPAAPPPREGLKEGVPLPPHPPVALPHKDAPVVEDAEGVLEAVPGGETEYVEDALGEGDALAPPLKVRDARVVLDTLPLTATTVGVEGMDLVTVCRGEDVGE